MASLTCSHLPLLVGKQVYTATHMAGAFLFMRGSQHQTPNSTLTWDSLAVASLWAFLVPAIHLNLTPDLGGGAVSIATIYIGQAKISYALREHGIKGAMAD